jgi:DNA excision repair protein ERCC-4
MIIDSREEKRIIQKVKAKKDIEVKEDFLEVGDYLLNDGYTIERKTIQDFVASISDRRLFTQLGNLLQAENPLIAIINDNKWMAFYFSRNRYIHNVYIGTLTTITTSYPKIRMVFFDTEDEFISFVVSLEKKLKDEGKGERPKALMRKPTSIEDRKENCLCCAQGVGIKTAKTLLKKFKSVKGVANASEAELATVIGEKVVKNVREVLN